MNILLLKQTIIVLYKYKSFNFLKKMKKISLDFKIFVFSFLEKIYKWTNFNNNFKLLSLADYIKPVYKYNHYD